MSSHCYEDVQASAATTGFQDTASGSQSFVRTLTAIFGRVFSQLVIWQSRESERMHLSELPDYLLKDMGITPEQARYEASKPFWQS